MKGLRGSRVALLLGAAVGAGSCTTIDRPTGPGSHEPLGPHVQIVKPGRDTSIGLGQTVNFLITVTSTTGIDSIYTDVVGTTINLPPIADVVSPATFGFSVPAAAQTSGTIILRVTAVDKQGQPGDTALRFVQLQ